MADTPVTVIIPYSPEHTPNHYLQEAKKSVRNQSTPTNTIIIEDTEQRGPAWARNQGLKQASTRFVAFLDADDLWKDGKLDAQIQRIKESGAGICIGGDQVKSEQFMKDLFVMRESSLTSSILLDTDRVDVRFEEKLERREDHLFILEAAAQTGICFVPDIVEIRKHQGGLSSLNTPSLRIEQNELFIDYVAKRVDETLVENHHEELLHNLYHGLGRSEHAQGCYKSAIKYFRSSLTQEISIKTIGALVLSVLGCLWSQISS